MCVHLIDSYFQVSHQLHVACFHFENSHHNLFFIKSTIIIIDTFKDSLIVITSPRAGVIMSIEEETL